MKKKSKNSAPRDRILDTAEELFYSQGYLATGINQIIGESGVAKATFYAHFPSKDELCIAYLERLSLRETALMQETLAKKKTPIARYLTAFEVLEPWLIETSFRGCPFLNIASEISDDTSPIRKVGVQFYKQHKRLVEQSVKELIAADPKQYGHLKPDSIAESYMTIFVGAIGLCEVFHSIEPVKNGLKMVKSLVE